MVLFLSRLVARGVLRGEMIMKVRGPSAMREFFQAEFALGLWPKYPLQKGEDDD